MEDVGLDYWLRWQVPVCALIFLLPTLVSLRFIVSKKNTHTTKTHHLWMPCWRNLNPCWLLLYRLFSFFSMAYLLYQTVLAFGPFEFYFYTQLCVPPIPHFPKDIRCLFGTWAFGWTFCLVMVYFAIGTIISAHGCLTQHSLPYQERDKLLKKDSSSDNELQFNQEAGFWGNLMQNVYQICAGAVVLTDLVFWCLLLPFQTGDDFKLTLLIAFMHSLNAVFLLLDSALNSLQCTWHGLTYFVLWSAAYIVFQWVMHACCFSWWPYPFLEIATPWAPIWYFGIALVHPPCYGLYVWLVKVKSSMFSQMFPHAFTRWLPSLSL